MTNDVSRAGRRREAGAGMFGRVVVGAGLVAGVALMGAGPAEAAVRAAACPKLKGAAAEMFDQQKLCKNAADAVLGSAGSGKPVDWGKVLKSSTKKGKQLPAGAAPPKAAHPKAAAPKTVKMIEEKALDVTKEAVKGPHSSGKHGPGKHGLMSHGLPKSRPGQVVASVVSPSALAGLAKEMAEGPRPAATPSASARPSSLSATSATPVTSAPARTPTPTSSAVSAQGGPAAAAAESSGPRPLHSTDASDSSPLSGSGMLLPVSSLAVLVLGAAGLYWMASSRLSLAVANGMSLRHRRARRGRSKAGRSKPMGPPPSFGTAPPLPEAKRRSPFGPVRIRLGSREGLPVAVDLAELGGLRLAGPGGEAAERALLADLMTAGDGRTVLAGLGGVRRLLGEDYEADFAPGPVRIEDCDELVLSGLGMELARRHRWSEESHLGPRKGEDQPGPLVVLLDPAGADEGRLEAELRIAARLGVGAVMLGGWEHGTTLQVDESGLVVAATGRDTAHLFGVRLPLADPQAARASVSALSGPIPSPEPARRKPAVQAVKEPAKRAAGPAGERAAMVHLLGACSVTGPSGRAVVQSGDVQAFLALLAEHRSTVLPRQVVIDRLWGGVPNMEKRFTTVIRETRKKLCEALGLPGRDASRVITNDGNSFYRLNTDLITVDVWEIRDLITQAVTAPPAEAVTLLERAADMHATGGGYLAMEHGWAYATAKDLTRDIIGALVRLADLEPSPLLAVRHLERASDLDEAAECLYVRRMDLYAQAGDLAAVYACYEQLEDRLAGHGRQPEEATRLHFRHLTD